jgi:two-component system sensor kinase FixL
MDLSPLPLTLASKIEIEQVLINLVKNAIDAMADAHRRELRLATRIIESGYILVSVRDSGKGIAAGELDRVFDPFQTSKKEGLGLGLPICRSLVENYGGQIWAEQNGDGGVEFNFTLPSG